MASAPNGPLFISGSLVWSEAALPLALPIAQLKDKFPANIFPALCLYSHF
jgi:hypothetical protein